MVKCAECGFLTLRHRESRELAEVEWATRETGSVPTKGPYSLYERTPLCFERAFPLQEEAKGDSPDEVVRVFQSDRECPSFTPWQQGFTPKEHREMLDRREMRDWQERREREDRDWRERQEERQRQWQVAQARARLRWDIIIFGIVVTLAIMAATIIAAFIERGSLG